jgi:anti-anti-sigma regulatory factor
MTEAKNEVAKANSVLPEFNATAILDFTRRQKTVRLKLEGSIRSKQVSVLRGFLKTIVDVPGNKWMLQLGEVDAINRQGLEALARFAKQIRERGHVVRITSIQRPLLTALSELNLLSYFDLKK